MTIGLTAEPSDHAVADVWVVGSVNVDLVARVASLPRPGETVRGTSLDHGLGGKGANQAVAAARIGAAVRFVGAVGSDGSGSGLRLALAEAGVDVERLATVDGPTGTALVVVDSHGENSIVVIGGANDRVTATRFDPRRGDLVLTQGELPLAVTVAALTVARSAGATTVWNPAPADPEAFEHLALADVLIVNETELEVFGGSIEVLLERGSRAVVETLGGDGVLLAQGSDRHTIPARRVEVVDTTGAGDCFVGALAARFAAGDALDEAVAFGNVAASISVQRQGAAASMPTWAEVASVRSQ